MGYFVRFVIKITKLSAMQSRRGVSHDLKSKNSQTSGKGARDLYFLLLSPSHFGISVPYLLMTPQLKELLRNYAATWNPEAKAWECKMQHYKLCLQDLRDFFQTREEKQGGNVFKIPEFVFKANEEMPLELEIKNHSYSVVRSIKYSAVESAIDPGALPFFDKLYDFQKISLEFSIKRHGRLLLADEMGVGKTIQSLAMVSVYRHEWPFLIICPSTLRLNWQQEALNWLGDYLSKNDILVYCKGGQVIRPGIKAMIISYDLAWKIKDMLDMFAVVIADQAHYLKNSGNKRTDALMPFLSSRKRVILLTGTPALARPREIYNLVSIVRPDIFINFKEFGYRYCSPTVNPWSRGLEFNGCQNTKELYYILKDKVMIRRLKKEVLTQLPDKQRQKVLVETDKNIVREIKELLKGTADGGEQLVIEMLGNFNAEQSSAFGEDQRSAVMKAYVQTGLAKLQSTKEYVLSLLQNDIKLIVFAHHIAVLDGLEEAIKKDYKFMRIDGKVSKEQRHERVGLFQEDPAVRVALLSISAAGVGLTLTAASTVVFAELHWTPGMMVQAEDRAHRIGQKNSVNCHYLIGEGTLDDLLYRYLDKKVNNVSSFVDGKGEKLEMQYLQKGQKGKFSVSSGQERSDQSILFKFQSIKPVIEKYFMTKSQETEISESESREDIDSEVGVARRKRRGQPLSVPEEESPNKEINSDNEDCAPQSNPGSISMGNHSPLQAVVSNSYTLVNAQELIPSSQESESTV